MAGLGPLSERYGRLLESLAVTSIGPGKVFVVSDGSTYPNLREYQRQFGGKEIVKASLADAASAYKAGRGDTILVMPGSYTISTKVTFSKSHLRLIGLGASRTRITTATTNGLVGVEVTADDVLIQGISFGCEAADNDGGALFINGGDRCVIRDCELAKSATNGNPGLQVDDCDGLTVERTLFRATTGIDFATDDDGDITDVVIRDCDFLDGTDAMAAGAGANDLNLDVIGCRFFGITTPFALDDGGAGTVTGTIAGCTVDFAANTLASWGDLGGCTATANAGTAGLQTGVPA